MTSVGQSLYRIIKKPVVTEKTALASSFANAYVFEVAREANKNEIKRAIEKVFEVKVKKVRTAITNGKIKRVKNKAGRTAAKKKAYVMLQPGDTINLADGV